MFAYVCTGRQFALEALGAKVANSLKNGGGRGIRTPGTLSSTTVFKTGAFNHSAIPPCFYLTLLRSSSWRQPSPHALTGSLLDRVD